MTAHKLVLIDGHALAYRMFYALPLHAFTTKEGEPTNATYGFTRTLLDIMLGDDPPHYLAVSFDMGMTFRDEMFADYKATREKMPDELDIQIERIKEVVETLNIPVLAVEGYEADDVLGTIAAQAKAKGAPAYIVTGDRDLLQLVDENTRVELPTRGSKSAEVFDPEGVENYFGVRPDQVVDYKAMVGDSSDNIPGVRGVGKKTAARLLQKYGTLDEIYAHLDEIGSRWRTKLEEGREEAYLSQKLARIVTDAPIELDLEACVAQDFEAMDVLHLFHELEFRTLSDTLLEHVENPRALRDAASDRPPTEPVLIRSEAELAELIERLNQADAICIDLETTSLDKIEADIVGIALAIEPPVGYYIPVGHLADAAQADSGQMSLFAGEGKRAEGQLSLDYVLDALQPPLTDPDIPKIAHNAKYDYTILDRHGLRLHPLGMDTMIAEWLTDPSTKHKGLKDLARHRLGIEMTEIEALIGKGKKQKSFAEVPIDEAAPYAAADADLTLRLVKPLRAEIEEKGLEKILEIEMPLIPILSQMEQAGVGVDEDFFHQMSVELDERLEALEATIHEIAGEPFNVNSTQQLSEVLFTTLGLPTEGVRKTKSGYYSTAASVLESVQEADESGIIDAILEYRELGKLKSTYVDALPELVNPETGRIHTSFNQTGAVTGRLASRSPNLQNIPIRSDVGQKIRRGFVARQGWLFLAADYSQVELRILAHASQDEALLAAFRQGQDIHRTTAAAVYGIPLEEVTYNQRRFAKAVNFGLIYGMGAYRLARDSELTLGEAEDYIEEYFARFPGIRRYLDETKELAHEQGYVETLLGRRRYFPVFQTRGGSRNWQALRRAEREAINHPIQGSAADIIKIAMIDLYRALQASNYRAQMVLQIHDELMLEVPEGEMEAIRPLVIETMSNAFKLDVPLKVDASVGPNWLALKE